MRINKFTNRIVKLNLVIVVLFFVISIANAAMPFYTKSMKHYNIALTKFSTIFNTFYENEIIKNGRLVLEDKITKSDEDYAIVFNVSENAIKQRNYLLFNEEELIVRIGSSSNGIKYPSSGSIGISQIYAVVLAAMETLPGLSLVSSLMLSALILFLLNVILISSVYFFFNKDIELINIIKITVTATMIPSFILSVISIWVTLWFVVQITILSLLMTLLTLFLLKDKYKELKIKEYKYINNLN